MSFIKTYNNNWWIREKNQEIFTSTIFQLVKLRLPYNKYYFINHSFYI